MKKILGISALILVIGLVLTFIGLASVGFDIKKLDRIELVRNEYTSEAEVFEKIKIDVKDVDVNIVSIPNGQGTLVVSEDDEDVEYSVSFSGGVLNVEEASRPWYDHIGFSTEKTSLTVYIPEGMQGEIEIVGDSSDINFVTDRISFESININIDSGDVNLTATSRGDINITTNSGDVDVMNASAQAMEIKVDSGDVEITRTAITGLLKIISDSGEIDIDASDAFTLDISADSGDVSAELRSIKNVDAVANSGDCDVKASNPAGGYCKIRTRSGDIEVKYYKADVDG